MLMCALSYIQELSLYFDSSIYHSFCLNGLRSEMCERASRATPRTNPGNAYRSYPSFFSAQQPKKSYYPSFDSFCKKKKSGGKHHSCLLEKFSKRSNAKKTNWQKTWELLHWFPKELLIHSIQKLICQ